MGFDDVVEGHPGRATEEVLMRTKLETVRAEVEKALKMQRATARGESKSWLKHIEHQNEENAYQVRLKASLGFLWEMPTPEARQG